MILDVPRNACVNETFQIFCQKKYGVYAGFSVKHLKKDGTAHVHLGIIFRDKPTDLYWDKVNEYFGTSQNEKFKNRSRDFKKKLQTYWDYCVDSDKHPHEDISERYLHKWIPENKIRVNSELINIEKCTTRVWFLHLLKKGKTWKQILNLASITREATLYYDAPRFKKMFRNYIDTLAQHILFRPLQTFRKDVLEKLKCWDPSTTSLLLRGRSNQGKTELAKALIKERTGEIPCFCSNLNRLASRDPNQPIIYDDLNFKYLSRSKVIALTDTGNDRDIRILFGIHTVEAGTPRVFTTNESWEEQFPHDPYGAIRRRVKEIDLDYKVLY